MERVDNYSVAREFIQFLMLFFAISKKPRRPRADIKLHSRAFDVLFTLQVFPGREPTMSALAEEMGISKQQLTKLITPMEDQGLVVRTHDRSNRRQVRIAITGQGKQVVESLLEGAAEQLTPEMAVFTQEEKQEFLACAGTFRRLLSKLEKGGKSA